MVKGKDKAYTPTSEEILRNRQTPVKPLVDSYFAWENIAGTLSRRGKVPAPVRCCTVSPKPQSFSSDPALIGRQKPEPKSMSDVMSKVYPL